MLKKAGILTAGVTAALLAAAPLASAGEYNGDYDKDRDRGTSHDGDRDRDRDRDRGSDVDFGDVDGKFNNQCSSQAGDVDNDTAGVGGLIGLGQVLGPVASGSNVNVLNCANILNDNLNDNALALGLLGQGNALSSR